jgi:hypothetical protein
VFHNHDIGFRKFCDKYKRYGYGVALHYSKISKKRDDVLNDDYYITYCFSYEELISKIFLMWKRSQAYLKRFVKINDVGWFDFLCMKVLAFFQEFFFQFGAVKLWMEKK